MAISDELRAQILRYHFVEHWRVGTIASQLRVHHYTVERVLGEAGVEHERQRRRRASKLDPYRAFITETLERFPTLSAARLFDMVKARGYPGGPDHFRHSIAQLRPRRPREAYLRLRTLAGCCFSLCLVESPRQFAGLFRRRIAWDDEAIREAVEAGAVAVLMNRCCRSGEDLGVRAPSVGKGWASALYLSMPCPHGP